MAIRKPQLVIVSGLLATGLLAGLGIWISRPEPVAMPHLPKKATDALIPAAIQRQQIAEIAPANPALAEKQYRAFIAANCKVKDPKVQEEVGKARFGVGYIVAGRKDFHAARAEFLEASADYRGTGAMDPDFGGIKDGAAYQAAVCLVAEGRTNEARAAFIAFLKNYPESPLSKAAFRRLVRLNGGKDLPEYDRLVNHDVEEQQKKAKFEEATCGPRALAYLLPLLGKPPVPYEKLARLCGTTDKGTSLEQLRAALKSFGIESLGYELNAKDFQKIATPAIFMHGDHFVVLTKVEKDWIEIYDPLYVNMDRQVLPLPDDKDGRFRAVVLVFHPLDLDLSGEDQPAQKPLIGSAAAKQNEEDVARKHKLNEARVRQALADEKAWKAKK